MPTNIAPDTLKTKLETLVQEWVHGTVDTERTRQLLMLQRNERYWQGLHYHFPTLRGKTIEWSSATGHLLSTQERRNRGLYDYVLNYYYGDGLKLVGILGRIPNARAVANRNTEVSNSRANKANEIIAELAAHWDLESLQPELVLSLFKNGPTFGYTPYSSNKARYGSTSVPVLEMRNVQIAPDRFSCRECFSETPFNEVSPLNPVCPGCQAPFAPESILPAEHAEIPEVVDTLSFPNGSVECYLCTPYTVTTPFNLKNLDASPWLMYEYDEHISTLMAAHPVLRKERGRFETFNTNLGWQQAATFARERASSPLSGYTQLRKGTWRYSRLWLKPEMFWLLSKDGEEDIPEILHQQYPNGLKLTMVNGHIVKPEAEALGEVWACCKPTVGEYLYSAPLGNPYIRGNDLINDGYNIMVKTAEKGIPINFYDPNVLDGQALKENEAEPMDFFPALPGVSGRMRDAIWSTDPAKLNPVTTELMTTALSSTREIVGITPALTGQETVKQTLGEAELKRNQALQPHNTTWTFIRKFIARLYENAIVQFAKNSTGKLYFQQPSRSSLPPRELELGDISDLLQGGWHVQVEETIPMTYGQMRAQVWQIIQAGPPLWQLFGLHLPANIQAVHDIMGNNKLRIPGAEAREKVMEIIGRLLEQPPIVQPQMMMGMPPVTLPSIPADEFEDDHLLSAQIVKEWAQTKEGRHQKDVNPEGYANVIAWGRQHLQMANAAMAPPPGEEPPSGGGPTPAPPANAKPSLAAPPSGPALRPPQPPPRPEEMATPMLEGR